MKRFIRNLPGVSSYCNCTKPCSPIEVEHAYPRSLLKHRLKRNLFIEANQDMHNLHKCCSKLNRLKANYLLGNSNFNQNNGNLHQGNNINIIEDEFNGLIARSCLYMNDKYSLDTDKQLVLSWLNYSLLYPPLENELERHKIIYEKTGSINYFINYFTDKN